MTENDKNKIVENFLLKVAVQLHCHENHDTCLACEAISTMRRIGISDEVIQLAKDS